MDLDTGDWSSSLLLILVYLSQLEQKKMALKLMKHKIEVWVTKLLQCLPNAFKIADFIEERLSLKHANDLAIFS